MFSVNVKYADGVERLFHSAEVQWEPKGPVAGVLILDNDELDLGAEDVAFVANFRGQTVRIYGKKPVRSGG